MQLESGGNYLSASTSRSQSPHHSNLVGTTDPVEDRTIKSIGSLASYLTSDTIDSSIKTFHAFVPS